MKNNTLISFKYGRLFWEYKALIIRNVLITAFITTVISLIMPRTFKSFSVLMPPKAESEHRIFQDFEGMAFGNLFSSGSDEIANSLLAKLKFFKSSSIIDA